MPIRCIDPLNNFKVKDLLESCPDFLVTLKSDRDSCLTTLKKFALHKISSAPVFDGAKHLGFLDLLDILAYMLAILSTKPGSTFTSPQELIADYDYKQYYLNYQEVFKREDDSPLTKNNLADLVDLSQRNPFLGAMEDSNIVDCIVAFAKGLHRMAVTNSHDQITHILTQSSVVKFLAADDRRLGALKDKTLESLGLSFSVVISTTSDTMTVKAFQLMYTSKISGLPIVDATGKLVGNLSASDLKLLVHETSNFNFDLLFKPLFEVLPLIDKINKRNTNFLACCTPSDTVGVVVKKFAESGVHRLYVINENKAPVGVISLTKLCEMLLIIS